MNDYVLRIISRESNIRGLFATTAKLAQEAVERHRTTGVASQVLAESLTGGVLLGALLKVRHRVALKFEGNGPVRKAVVEADSYGYVRGYVSEPDLAGLGTLSTAAALGSAGLLTVTKDLKLKDLFEGVVHLETSEIDKDLTYYLNQSEQIPSHVALGVALNGNGGTIAVSGGLLLQSLPPYQEGILDRYVDRLQELPPLDDLFKQGKSPEEVAALVMKEEPYEILESRPLSFRCQCSRERSRQALVLLGAQEIQQLIDEVGEAIIDCHFCHDQYRFSAEELVEIIREF